MSARMTGSVTPEEAPPLSGAADAEDASTSDMSNAIAVAAVQALVDIEVVFLRIEHPFPKTLQWKRLGFDRPPAHQPGQHPCEESRQEHGASLALRLQPG